MAVISLAAIATSACNGGARSTVGTTAAVNDTSGQANGTACNESIDRIEALASSIQSGASVVS